MIFTFNINILKNLEKEITSVLRKSDINDINDMTSHFIYLCIHEHLINISRHGVFKGKKDIDISMEYIENLNPGIKVTIKDSSNEFYYKDIKTGIGHLMIFRFSDTYLQSRTNENNVLVFEKNITWSNSFKLCFIAYPEIPKKLNQIWIFQ